MVVLELLFDDDHEQAVEILQIFKLLFQGLVLGGQLGPLLLVVALHEESFERGLVTS